MINQIKNILLLGLLAVFLTSCGSSVKEIASYYSRTSFKTPLNIPNPDPLQMRDIEWIIVTKDNAMEIFEETQIWRWRVFSIRSNRYRF